MALLAAFLAAGALAQFPAKPIRLIVATPPGGALDILARIYSPKLGDLLGQPVLVENRPGANGNLASELTAHAPPDGYTMLLTGEPQITINPHLYKMPVDTLRDLAPVATLAMSQITLVVPASMPVASLQEFIDYARRSNPPLAYGSIGTGSQHHLIMEMLKARTGVPMVHVPYKGGGPAVTALLAGEISAMWGGASVASQVRAGKLRALAVAGSKRSAAYPNLPTLNELYPGVEITAWLALFTRAGTPEAVLSRLRSEVNRVTGDADIAKKIAQSGDLEPLVMGPEEFSKMLQADFDKYRTIVKSLGLRVD